MIAYHQRGDTMQDQDINGVSDFSDEEARVFISLLFDGYLKRKEENRLYSYEGIPEIIIKTYYSHVKRAAFPDIVENFKRRYIYHENKIEDVHAKEERSGLSAVYNYIVKKEDLDKISIYDLTYIHEELYSKTPHPEFGGQYRNHDGFILDSSVEITPYYNIVHEMNLLKPLVNELVKEGVNIRESTDVNALFQYIDKCIELNCKLIKIHPFRDGNGRSCRAFLNLLFKIVNIPPVYIENKEKEKYKLELNKAIVQENYGPIKEFYHYKICDSIVALDVAVKKSDFSDDDSIDKGKGVMK